MTLFHWNLISVCSINSSAARVQCRIGLFQCRIVSIFTASKLVPTDSLEFVGGDLAYHMHRFPNQLADVDRAFLDMNE